MFDKSPTLFPVRDRYVYLAHCAVGPLYAPAAARARAFLQAQEEEGMVGVGRFAGVLTSFRGKAAALLGVPPEDVAYVSNTAEGMSLLANGYPFRPGDQVLSWVHEFPSNHYPWALQRRRGVELVLLGDVDPVGDLPADAPRAFSMEELEARTTARTRVVALSHVQFTSGWTADLEAVGAFCRARGIDLVVDAAQSLGALPVRPAELGIAAVVASTWKWLLASRGAGLLYASPELRARLEVTVAGNAGMRHRLDYLNHAWDPDPGARRFEYSTLPWEHLLTLETALEEVFLRYGGEAIRDEVLRLQDILLARLGGRGPRPLVFERRNRSGILSFRTDGEPAAVVARLAEQGIVASTAGGYLRLAPHFYLEDADMERVAEALAEL